MDSMRSLNRSLPSTRLNKVSPPEELLPAFKQAALSVTNLYKSAASYHDSIRQAGYQDALDDLLTFLDRQNLGLQDGEGWKVRQWITARYDISHIQQGESDDDEPLEQEQDQRNSSPERSTRESPNVVPESPEDAAATDHSQAAVQEQDIVSTPPVFQFAAGPDNSMQTDDNQTPSEDTKSAPVRVEAVNRANRNAHRHNNSRYASRPSTRISTQLAGSKRKLPLPDFAEIFKVSFDKKDGFDGGSANGGGVGGGGSSGNKRSRFV